MAFVPSVSLHAAVRSAEMRGERFTERQLAADVAAHQRAVHHVTRLFKMSTLFARHSDDTGIWATPTRTRALVVCDGVIVTVIYPIGRRRELGDKKLRSIFTRLLKSRFTIDGAVLRDLDQHDD